MMTKILASCAAVALTAAFAMPVPASASDGVRNVTDQTDVSAQRRHRVVRYAPRRYYAPRYRYGYARPYYYDAPYYAYRPYYGPAVGVGVGPFGFGFGFR